MPGKTKVLKKPARTLADQSYLLEVMKGLGTTLKHFFQGTGQMVSGNVPDAVKYPLAEGIATISYPEEKRVYPERFRGVHRLTHRTDGSPRCVACLCCSTERGRCEASGPREERSLRLRPSLSTGPAPRKAAYS